MKMGFFKNCFTRRIIQELALAVAWIRVDRRMLKDNLPDDCNEKSYLNNFNQNTKYLFIKKIRQQKKSFTSLLPR